MRSVIPLACLFAVLWAVLVWGPTLWGRATVPNRYFDVAGLEAGSSYSLDPSAVLSSGDAVCYGIGTSEAERTHFGWVVAIAGDVVAVRSKVIYVNGKAERRSSRDMPDAGPLVIPHGHVFIVNDRKRTDSFGVGPLPLSAIRGRIGQFP